MHECNNSVPSESFYDAGLGTKTERGEIICPDSGCLNGSVVRHALDTSSRGQMYQSCLSLCLDLHTPSFRVTLTRLVYHGFPCLRAAEEGSSYDA